MTGERDTPITEILGRVRRGEDGALDELVPLIYQELRGLARSHRRRNQADLGTESLVHEAFMKLVRVDVDSRDRAQFFALASKAMRSLLVDAARRRGRIKRGGDLVAVDLELDEIAPQVAAFPIRRAEDLLDLDQALQELQHQDPELLEIVECRFFGGLSVEETAAALELSSATVKRRWAAAKLRLFSQLGSSPPAS